jgi:putative FmdB family regulatory protein
MSRVPTYEYACKQCGEHLEVVQKFTDEPLTTCPACEGPLRKVFGSIGISFKGSGFYKNDSRASENGKKKDKDKEKDSPAKPSGDSESKPKADTPAAKPDAPKSDKGSSTAAAS